MLFRGVHFRIAVNLLKHVLFGHTARILCLSKICRGGCGVKFGLQQQLNL